MQRRLKLLFVLGIAFVFIVGSLLFSDQLPDYRHIYKPPLVHDAPEAVPGGSVKGDDSSTNTPASAPPPPPKTIRQLNITITETGGSHDEVVAALVHAFGSLPGAEIDLYQLLPRYRISEIMAKFELTSPLPKPKGPDVFKQHGMLNKYPEVFVAGTCELDIIKFREQLDTLLAARKTFMFCVVHHADRWADPKLGLEAAIKPWVEAGLVEFLSLSPHTAKFLQEQSIAKWATTVPSTVHAFYPIFPVPLPEDGQEELSFGLQGDYDPARRDYNKIFTQLSSFIKSGGAAEKVIMHLLGHGKHPTVPPEVVDHVHFDEQLDYFQFYGLISKTFALLPAFASNEYLDRKASSSVPASLIGGTPLVAKRDIINAYSYINEDVVWLQGDEESDLDVVGRVLKLTPEERQKKKQVVREFCSQLIASNTKTVEGWVTNALDNKLKSH